MVLFDLPVHVIVIHAPDPVFILHKFAEDHLHAGGSCVDCVAEIERAVKKDAVTGFREHSQRSRNKAVDSIFISDVFLLKI